MIKKLLKNDKFIISLILINSIVLFLESFHYIKIKYTFLDEADFIISAIFVLEMLFKVSEDGFKGYIKDNWNKLDFVINLLIIPSFIFLILGEHNFFFLTILRLVRVAKFFRFFRFIPNINHLISGLRRALKSSVFIFIIFFLYLFIIAIISCFFFREVSPEHFGDPMLSLYSTFKIFTIEGWYELPELISTKYGDVASFGVKIYFIFLVLTGGVFGIGMVNAVFVDELVADNNDELVELVREMKKEIEELRKDITKKDLE